MDFAAQFSALGFARTQYHARSQSLWDFWFTALVILPLLGVAWTLLS